MTAANWLREKSKVGELDGHRSKTTTYRRINKSDLHRFPGYRSTCCLQKVCSRPHTMQCKVLITLTYVDVPSFMVWKQNNVFLPTECHYLRQDRRSTEPPCTLQHSAVMLGVCSMLLTIANSPAGLWSDKICTKKKRKRVKLLTLYKAWLETRIAFRCECPAAGLVTCQVHPGQSLQIRDSNKNKQRQNEPSSLWTLTQLFKYSPSPSTIFQEQCNC